MIIVILDFHRNQEYCCYYQCCISLRRPVISWTSPLFSSQNFYVNVQFPPYDNMGQLAAGLWLVARNHSFTGSGKVSVSTSCILSDLPFCIWSYFYLSHLILPFLYLGLLSRHYLLINPHIIPVESVRLVYLPIIPNGEFTTEPTGNPFAHQPTHVGRLSSMGFWDKILTRQSCRSKGKSCNSKPRRHWLGSLACGYIYIYKYGMIPPLLAVYAAYTPGNYIKKKIYKYKYIQI